MNALIAGFQYKYVEMSKVCYLEQLAKEGEYTAENRKGRYQPKNVVAYELLKFKHYFKEIQIVPVL